MADSPDATVLRRRARRRLVGAIALVVFVVIVLPLVLDQEPKPATQALTVQIPSQDSGPFNTRVLPPLPAPAAAAPKSESAPATEEKSKAPRPEPKSAESATVSRPRTAAKESAKTVAKGGPKTELAEARRAEALLNDLAYVVPLGAFANSDNVKQVQDKAAAAGIKSYTEKIKSQQGEQIRVRAGPFSSREAADKARDTLRSLGLAVGQVTQR